MKGGVPIGLETRLHGGAHLRRGESALELKLSALVQGGEPRECHDAFRGQRGDEIARAPEEKRQDKQPQAGHEHWPPIAHSSILRIRTLSCWPTGPCRLPRSRLAFRAHGNRLCLDINCDSGSHYMQETSRCWLDAGSFHVSGLWCLGPSLTTELPDSWQ